MCRHCEHLVEDKTIVHAFMEQAAKRISERDNEIVTADDLDARIERTKIEWVPNPIPMEARLQMMRMLEEMHR